MSQPTHISDDPLPPADPVEPLPQVQADSHASPPAHDSSTLDNPDLSPASSYGRTDPASLAAVQSHDLADPSLNPAANTELSDPTLTRFEPGAQAVTADPTPADNLPNESTDADFSNWDPHLAHLAQVGLTPADHWDEQIKPRIDQLHEDITQVNEQLDDLEKAKPKPKKS
jgi:hypothetical protein